ncbi:hypothetical protein G7K71_08685 [Desulfofundulus sp. TPOSR]|uniref:phage tail protein n=1 Tax=Desulfofundulus sp. TPOSR TaxID=2714340 RepID=UPI001408C6B0|nr:phage tail protein [Desulfofundulus sp. TPOSR]NHM25472.1 hypothetical protein [Desulfofundulus sp. TPOSR]NHM27060.1 hypothetical protein [Desulfofundulus sp. TPOSR]
MNTVTTKQARIDMARARAGEIVLPQVTHIAFGTGGHEPGDVTKPIPPSENDTALEQEVIRVPIASRTRINETTVRYKVSLAGDQANGMPLTEAGLIDSNGRLVARKTFGAKVKEPDVSMDFEWDEEF